MTPSSDITISFKAFIHKSVTPFDGAWAFEPMGDWNPLEEGQFRGDARGFGEPGTSRLSHAIKFKRNEIGRLQAKRPYSAWIHSNVDYSHRRGRSVQGMTTDRQKVWSPWTIEKKRGHDKSTIVQVGPSRIQVKGAASYPFGLWAPDINYVLNFEFSMVNGKQRMRAFGDHNQFPFYELIVNGRTWYSWSPPDKGPNPINLHTSKPFDVKNWI